MKKLLKIIRLRVLHYLYCKSEDITIYLDKVTEKSFNDPDLQEYIEKWNNYNGC